MDTLCVWYLWIGTLKGHLHEGFKAHRPFSIKHIGIYRNTFMDLSLSNTPVLYLRLSLSRSSPFYDSSPQAILHRYWECWSGFEEKFYGFLEGFHRFGSFKYFGCLFYIDVLMWRYQSEVLGLYLAFISHVKIHFLYISCSMRFCTLSSYSETPPLLSYISLAQI